MRPSSGSASRRVALVAAACLAACLIQGVPRDASVVAAASEPPVVVDTLGGAVADLVGRDDRLFLAVGTKVYLLTIPPTGDAPSLAGVAGPFDSPAMSIAIRGDVAYVALASGAVAMIDVARPASPVLLAQLPCDVKPVRIVADERHVYYAAEDRSDGTSVITILAPGRPSELRVVATITDPLERGLADIVVQDGILYVAAGIHGIGVWDVADAAQPRLVSWVENVRAWRLSIDGALLAVLRDWAIPVQNGEVIEEGVSLFEVVETGGIRWRGDLRTTSNLVDLTLSDAVVYARSGGAIVLVDASDPDSPTKVSPYLTITPTAVLAGKPYVRGDRLFVGRGATTYVAGPDAAPRFECLDVGVSVVDVHDPAALAVVGSWSVPVPGETTTIAAAGDVLAVGDTCGVRLLDVTVASAPTQRSYLGAVEFYFPQFLALVDDLLYLMDDFWNLDIVDVRDIAAPHVLARLDLTPADPGNRGGRRGMTVGDGRVVILTHHGYLTVVDVADPGSAGVVFDGKILQSTPYGAVARADLLYVATSEGLTIVDMSLPRRPIPLSTVGRPMRAVAVEGRHAYGAVGIDLGGLERGGVLDIVDVADEVHPVVAGSLDAPLERSAILAPWTASYERDRVVITSASRTLHIVDVSDPTRPRERTPITLGSGVYGAAVRDGTIYAAAGPSGLVMIEGALDNRSSPRGESRLLLPLACKNR